MGVWTISLSFADRRGKRRMSFQIGNALGADPETEFTNVLAAAEELETAFQAATNTSVGSAVTYWADPVDTVGMSEQVNRHSTMQYVTYLDNLGPTGDKKTWTFGVPAPIGNLFDPGDAKLANLSATELADIMTALQNAEIAGVFISDGETIDYSLGSNGIKSGRYISRKGA